MSRKKSKPETKKPGARIPRKYLLIAGVIIIACAIIVAVFITGKPVVQTPAANPPMNASVAFQTAGNLYSQSVDLANEGNYTGALAEADQALAMNVTSLVPLIQSNRAGILVELGRYNDAISAADIAINAQGNVTTLRAIAYYNRANALNALGQTSDANADYANASALDPTLKHP